MDFPAVAPPRSGATVCFEDHFADLRGCFTLAPRVAWRDEPFPKTDDPASGIENVGGVTHISPP